MKRAINGFPWERSFANLDINDKVYLFNKTIKNETRLRLTAMSNI